MYIERSREWRNKGFEHILKKSEKKKGIHNINVEIFGKMTFNIKFYSFYYFIFRLILLDE